MRIIDKIAWIEIQNEKILSTRSVGRSKFYFPGGKRENGESDADCLIREIHEELSVNIIPDTIEYMGTFEAQADSHPEGIKVKMTCYFADYSGRIQKNNEIEELAWLDYQDRERVSEVDKLILEDLLQKGILKS